MNCQKVSSKLADLLLDPESVSLEVRKHIEDCRACEQQLAELRSTMGLLDEWAVPEANPYFDARLLARLRDDEQIRPIGLWERVKARFLYGSSLRMQPLMAGALALVVLVGGGTYADLSWQAARHTDESAAVRDLQSLDGDAQVYQQLDSIDASAAQQDQGSGTQSSD